MDGCFVFGPQNAPCADNNIMMQVNVQSNVANPAQQIQSGVADIVGQTSNHAFAALKEDGSVIVWGKGSMLEGSGEGLDMEVKSIVANGGAFVALKVDGSLVCFGHSNFGGVLDESVQPWLERCRTPVAWPMVTN